MEIISKPDWSASRMAGMPEKHLPTLHFINESKMDICGDKALAARKRLLTTEICYLSLLTLVLC